MHRLFNLYERLVNHGFLMAVCMRAAFLVTLAVMTLSWRLRVVVHRRMYTRILNLVELVVFVRILENVLCGVCG